MFEPAVNFSQASTDAPGRSLTKFEYDFDGDGTYDFTSTSPAATLDHIYSATGIYIAKLQVTDDLMQTAGATRTITVTKAPTATTLTSSLNPSGVGESVTFTATVAATPAGTVPGSVTFRDGTTDP